MLRYYSIIQFCPDIFRHEMANIGVALFDFESNETDIKMLEDNTRILKFFSVANEYLNEIKDSISETIKYPPNNLNSLEHLKEYIDGLGNDIKMTVLYPIHKNGTIEESLTGLFSRLVEYK